MPIYYVIFEYAVTANQIPIANIVRSIECNLEDADSLYRDVFRPMHASNFRLQVMFVYREPDNPFKEKATTL